jgi:hypothetical protein
MFDIIDCDKNIIMQLRKSVSLRGNYEVIFNSGEKEFVSPEYAHKALDLFNFQRTTAEKDYHIVY